MTARAPTHIVHLSVCHLCRPRIMLPLADGSAVRHGQQQLPLARGLGQHERALRAHAEAMEAPIQP